MCSPTSFYGNVTTQFLDRELSVVIPRTVDEGALVTQSVSFAHSLDLFPGNRII